MRMTLNYLKEKRTGVIRGEDVLLVRSKEQLSATIYTESLFLTCVIDALEQRHVVKTDIPGAFMHEDIDELVHYVDNYLVMDTDTGTSMTQQSIK